MIFFKIVNINFGKYCFMHEIVHLNKAFCFIKAGCISVGRTNNKMDDI